MSVRPRLAIPATYRALVHPPGTRHIETLDQRALPHAVISVKIASADAAAMAIRTMWVRGAPLIGAVGAYGLALALDRDAGDDALAQGARGARCDAPHGRQSALGARSRARRGASARCPADAADAAWREADAIAAEDEAINHAIGVHRPGAAARGRGAAVRARCG